MKRKLVLICTLLIAGVFISTSANSYPCLFFQEIKSAQQQPKTVHPSIPMSADSLNRILNRMRQKSNDADKIRVFKAGLKDKGISVEQIVTLLNQFQQDNSKLQCAIFAYPYTIDYKDYLTIQDNFATEANKGALADYIKKQHKKDYKP